MTKPQSTITQDEYDALKVMLAARDREIERLQSEIREVVNLMRRWDVFGSGEDQYYAFIKRNAEK